jgi:AcrR family transcriptional regulator
MTVADIAAAADVSPRSVFNHFATKDDAILGHDPERARELRAAIEAIPPDVLPVEAVRSVLLDVVAAADDLGTTWRQRAELVERHPSLLPAQMAAMAEFEAEVAQAIATRTGLDVDADAYPRLAAAICLTAVRTAIRHAVASEHDNLAAAVEGAFDLVRSGLPQQAAT